MKVAAPKKKQKTLWSSFYFCKHKHLLRRRIRTQVQLQNMKNFDTAASKVPRNLSYMLALYTTGCPIKIEEVSYISFYFRSMPGKEKKYGFENCQFNFFSVFSWRPSNHIEEVNSHYLPVPLQFFDVLRQNGWWKTPKCPPFQFFGIVRLFF